MQDLKTAIERAISEVFDLTTDVLMSRPDEQFGDYTTNVALQLAGQLGQNPRIIAERLIAHLGGMKLDEVNAFIVAGAGFINIRLTDGALIESMQATSSKPLLGKSIVAEYSDPNPFKTLHAGHLYTTVVGNCIANLLSNAGANVQRVNFGGDVGLHVGKTMWAIKQELGGWDYARVEQKFANSANHNDKFGWLSKCYVAGNKAYEEDDTAKKDITDINAAVYTIHATAEHSTGLAQIYWECRAWSYDYFKYFYETIQVQAFDRYLPESETFELGLRVVEQQLAAGVYQKSDGAVVFVGEPYGLHTRVFINSNGLPTYEAKDVGLLLTKWRDYQFDQSVIVTGNDIVEYMKVVLKSVEQFEPDPVLRTRHITHGQVKLAGGVKMSSRKGNVLGALEIIEAAAVAAQAYALQSGHEFRRSTVYDAFKYAFLKNRIGGDVLYDPNESVSLEGNSGPYLQYAHARACSILSKAERTLTLTKDIELTDGERSLVRKLANYNETVLLATSELMPHHICNYLYELAQTFNRFYEHNRVLGDERQELRLSLVDHYVNTLRSGLGLLGISAPTAM